MALPHEWMFYEVTWRAWARQSPYPLPWWLQQTFRRYAVTFFVIVDGKLHLPQLWEQPTAGAALQQGRQDGYLPVITTTYSPPAGVQVQQRTLGTTVGLRQRSIVLNRLVVAATGGSPRNGQLGIAVIPVKPSGFVRHDRAGRYLADSQLTFLRYLPDQRRLETNTPGSGPSSTPRPRPLGSTATPTASRTRTATWPPTRTPSWPRALR